MWESYLGKVVDRDTPFDIRKGYVRLVDVLCHILESLVMIVHILYTHFNNRKKHFRIVDVCFDIRKSCVDVRCSVCAC